MMQFYLIHVRHGKKIAYQDKEAEADKKVGWKEVTEDEFYGKNKKADAEVVTSTQDNDLVAQYKTKHGKKPHHRMSNDSIREALNDSPQA